MGIEDATQAINAILALLGTLIDWVAQLANPLDPGSTVLDWVFAIAIVTPPSFVIMRYLIQLAAGLKFKSVKIVVKKRREVERWKD